MRRMRGGNPDAGQHWLSPASTLSEPYSMSPGAHASAVGAGLRHAKGREDVLDGDCGTSHEPDDPTADRRRCPPDSTRLT